MTQDSARGSLHRAPPVARGRRSARAPWPPPGPASSPAPSPGGRPLPAPRSPPGSLRRRSRLCLQGSHRSAPGVERGRSAAVLLVSGAGRGTELRSLATLRASAVERGRWPRRDRQVSGGGGRERLRRCEHRPPSAPRSLAGSAGPERGRAGAGGGGEGADVARRLRSPGDREGGGSDSAGYSLTPRAERSPELTWLPGAAWVTELPKSPAARLADPKAGARVLVRDRPGLTSDAGVGGHRLLPPSPAWAARPTVLAPPPAEKKQLGGWGGMEPGGRCSTPRVASCWRLKH